MLMSGGSRKEEKLVYSAWRIFPWAWQGRWPMSAADGRWDPTEMEACEARWHVQKARRAPIPKAQASHQHSTNMDVTRQDLSIGGQPDPLRVFKTRRGALARSPQHHPPGAGTFMQLADGPRPSHIVTFCITVHVLRTTRPKIQSNARAGLVRLQVVSGTHRPIRLGRWDNGRLADWTGRLTG